MLVLDAETALKHNVRSQFGTRQRYLLQAQRPRNGYSVASGHAKSAYSACAGTPTSVRGVAVVYASLPHPPVNAPEE